MKRFAFLLFALFTLAAPTIYAQAPVWCVAVWYPSSEIPGGLEAIRDNSDLIGIVHPFWYTPAPDGTLIATPEAENADQLAAWRADGLTVVPSIFSSISEMIATEAARAFHVEQIVALVERMDYDGIDIDYEGFPRSTRENFSLFMEALSDALHQRGKLLTVAVHAKTDDAGLWDGAAAQDWARIAAAVDVFTIMTYDYTNRNEPPGPIAPMAWVSDVLAYAATVTDLSKVRMGLNFYGYSWLRDTPPATTTSWQAAQRLIDSFDIEVGRDPADMEAFIEFKARGLPKQMIYYADAAGLEAKLDMILAAYPELGGVAIWGVGGEDPANWDVLRDARQPNCAL